MVLESINPKIKELAVWAFAGDGRVPIPIALHTGNVVWCSAGDAVLGIKLRVLNMQGYFLSPLPFMYPIPTEFLLYIHVPLIL